MKALSLYLLQARLSNKKLISFHINACTIGKENPSAIFKRMLPEKYFKP
jgi:hypothetical protein